MLVTLDGSEFAEQVLKPASELAACCGSEVHLIVVLEPSEVHGLWIRPPQTEHGVSIQGHLASRDLPGRAAESRDQAVDRLMTEAKDYLTGVAGRYFPQGATETVTFGEDPVPEILKYVRQEHIDLIATATHGRTGLAETLLGSVASGLLRAGIVPMFIYRPQ